MLTSGRFLCKLARAALQAPDVQMLGGSADNKDAQKASPTTGDFLVLV